MFEQTEIPGVLIFQPKVFGDERGFFMETFRSDLFAGSGSTLIACERTGRRCAALELDPRYAEVILARFERFSGLAAERIDG